MVFSRSWHFIMLHCEKFTWIYLEHTEQSKQVCFSRKPQRMFYSAQPRTLKHWTIKHMWERSIGAQTLTPTPKSQNHPASITQTDGKKNPIVCILAITAGNWTWDNQDRQGACPSPRYLANTTGNHIRLACLGKANIPAMLHISHQLPGSFSLTMNFLFAQNSQSGRKHTVLSKWKKSWSISALYSKS